MRSFTTVENREEYADKESPDKVLMESEESPPWQDAGHVEKLFPLLDLIAGKPEVWKVLKIKLIEPHISSRELAARCGMKHTKVFRLLKEAEAKLRRKL